MPRRGPAADPFKKLTADLPGSPLERLGIERPGMVLVLKLTTLEPDTVVMDARTPELGGTTRILITAPSSIVRTQVHVEISGRSRKTR